MSSAAPPSGAASEVLPVIEEQLEVGRRRVETGAVRVRKMVHEQTVDVPGQSITERVRTERVAIGRVVQQRPEVRQEGDTVVVPVVEERVVVHTELVLVEELRITTHREVRDQAQAVTLHREEAVVERIDPQTQRWEPADPKT
jgi:uncharacterized protein (TIGR02271 family)